MNQILQITQVTIIRSTYSPYGGVERVALNTIKGLLAKDVRVILLTMPGQQWPIDSELLTVVYTGIGRGHRLLTAWAFNRGVTRYLSRNPSKIVYSLDRVISCTHIHAGGGTHRSFLRIKNANSNLLSRTFRQLSLFHRYTMYLERKSFQNPMLRKVRCNSSLVKEDIQTDYGLSEDKLVIIPSSIGWQAMETVFHQRESMAKELRALHGIDARWHCLLFLGSGFSRKGLDIAIQGVSTMAADYHLLVVGKGAIKGYRNLAAGLGIEDRVHFLGPHPEGWRYASLCRALVLASRYDPFGGAAAEGHAMGLPVLISDQTGYKDYVIPGRNGVILESMADDTAIARAFEALARIIEAPSWDAHKLRQHARQLDEAEVFAQTLTRFLG